MSPATHPRPQRTVIALTIVASAAMLVPGAWMWTDPQSFAQFANWPEHAHFLHDAGAFQMAIGLMLLAALRMKDVLTLVLGGFLFGNTLHAINHAKDLHLGGGNVFDPYVLGAFSVLAAVALVLRIRQLRRSAAGTGGGLMRVLLAGATGTVGTELTGQLLTAGHEVLGITRSQRSAERLRAAGAEVIIADMMARDALLEALEGVRADAVINQATAITKTPTRHRDLYATNALRSHGTANLLAAADLTGARRFVTQSFLFGYGYRDHGPVPVTEEAPFGEPGRGGFGRHLFAMRSNEDQVLGSRRVEGMALRYGVFYGPETSTLGLFDQLERRRLPVPSRSGKVSLVHVEDAAGSAVAALERGRGGNAYNIADDHPLTWTDYLSQIAEAAGGPPPWRVPGWVLRASPYLGTLMIGASLSLDTGKAKRELGWAPRYASCVEGLAQVARHRERERG